MRMVLALLMVAVSAACAMGQEATQAAAAAPIPTQIVAGKRAFISNAAGVEHVSAGMPEQTYNEFYAAMKSWGRYELVGAPADADVVIEIRIAVIFDGGTQAREFRVTMLDPKSRVVLWALNERIQDASRQATARKNFEAAMGALVTNVKSLGGQPASAVTGGQK